jgi:selenide, water dikinase
MPTDSAAAPHPRLTSLSHGGGCGCKIAPGVLADLLAKSPSAAVFSQLLVGTETSDDAAVYRLNDEQAVIATTDFFMPIVDDPFDFGRIAATNALSDVYAMGGTPIMALAILGMPVKVLPPDVIREILRGGESICAEAHIPIAGGHSIDSVEPIYGLVAIGVAHPRHVKRNSTAVAGDALVLGKPLGIGIFSAALKKGRLSDADYRTMIDSTTLLNRAGADLAALPGVHAMTDVTGFGLLGHLLEMCRGSNLGAHVSMTNVPVFDHALQLAESGIVTGASERNWASYGDHVHLVPHLGKAVKPLLCDPQTSGGLLVSCAPEAVDHVLDVFRSHGCGRAAEVGTMIQGPVRIEVES